MENDCLCFFRMEAIWKYFPTTIAWNIFNIFDPIWNRYDAVGMENVVAVLLTTKKVLSVNEIVSSKITGTFNGERSSNFNWDEVPSKVSYPVVAGTKMIWFYWNK